MDIRTERAVSVCVTYALLIALCVGLALEATTNPCTRESLLELPIWVQLLIAQAFGLTPLLVILARTTHWTVPYLTILVISFYVLYWLSWHFIVLDDEPV